MDIELKWHFFICDLMYYREKYNAIDIIGVTICMILLITLVEALMMVLL